MSLATVAAVVGIASAGYGVYNSMNQPDPQGGAGSNQGGPGGGPNFYVPTGQADADKQWQDLMKQLFGYATGAAGMLQPHMLDAYNTMRGIPTKDIERTGREAGQYYQNLAGSADEAHNLMAQRQGEDYVSKGNLQRQGSDWMRQMLTLGLPMFGKGEDFQKSMQPLAQQMQQAGQAFQGKLDPLAGEMAQGGRDFNTQMQAAMGNLFGKGNEFYEAQKPHAASLRGSGDTIWETALDPQQRLANRMQQQVTEGSRAATSARGIGMSGNAAGLENQALDNFLMDWQDRQLGRQATGLQGKNAAYGQAGQLENMGMQGLLGAYGTGGNLGSAGVNALFGGLGGAGNMLSSGLQGLFAGNLGAGNLMNQGYQGMLGGANAGQSIMNSGMQGLSNMYGMGLQYGNAANQGLINSVDMGARVPEYLNQSSMVPYLSQMFGPQMAMQFANMYGQGMQGNVYGPLSGAMQGYSPYLNYGMGATGNAFGQGQANLSNMYSGLSGITKNLPGLFNGFGNMFGGGGGITPGYGNGYGFDGGNGYGGSLGYGSGYYEGGGMGSP